MHITIVHFKAFTRECEVAFEDNSPVMLYSIKRRIRRICPTSNITRIKHYDAVLLNDEKINDSNTGDPRTQFAGINPPHIKQKP